MERNENEATRQMERNESEANTNVHLPRFRFLQFALPRFRFHRFASLESNEADGKERKRGK